MRFRFTDEVEALLTDVINDRQSGAAQIACKAADVIGAFATSSFASDVATLHQGLRDLLQRMCYAHAVMAPLWNLREYILTVVEQNANLPVEQLCTRVTQAAVSFSRSIERRRNGVAQRAANLITEGIVILTHSASSVVLATLSLARSQGKRFRVLCTESHPGGEGVALCEALRDAGVEVDLIADAMALPAMQRERCTMVLIGADAYAREGVVHKVGTWMLATSAQQLNIPVYSLGGTDKIMPSSAPPVTVLAYESRAYERMGDEQYDDKFTLELPYSFFWLFDVTPWSHITMVITERGRLTPMRLLEWLEEGRQWGA